MTKEKIQKQIEFLEKKRAKVFDKWSAVIKENDREYENKGSVNKSLEKKAGTLLAEQKNISNEIMRLLDKLEE